MKCARHGCNNEGVYQPLIRLRPGIIPANGKDVLATIRPPMTVCLKDKLNTSQAEIIALVPHWKMKALQDEAYRRTGSLVNPDRTHVVWVRILGRRTNG